MELLFALFFTALGWAGEAQMMMPIVGAVAPTAGTNCTPASGYSFCRSITIDHTKVGTVDSSNFAVLICGNSVSTACSSDTSYWKTVGNGGKLQSASCFDVIYTSDITGATAIAFEAVPVVTAQNCNTTTGAGEHWVLVGTLSHTTDTVIYTSYGKASITTDQSNKTGTWNSNYQGVYHLHNGTTLAVTDSTSNAKTLTNNGSVTAVAGQIDGGAGYAGAGKLTLAAGILDPTIAGATYSGWINASDVTTIQIILANVTGSSNRDHVNIGTGALRCGHYNGTTTFPASGVITTGLHHFTCVYDGTSTVTAYLDGALQVDNGAPAGNSNAGFSIGSRSGTATQTFFAGPMVDEVRALNAPMTASWITATYNNQSAPSTFFTIGAEH